MPDNSRAAISLTGVNGSATIWQASIGFLVGDVNSTRAIDPIDISAVKARSGQIADATDFQFDVNVSGAVNASDILAVKARSGTVLMPCVFIAAAIIGSHVRFRLAFCFRRVSFRR